MILEGPNAIEAARQLIGATNGIEAAPGSIRGDYALEVRRNLVHGSDSAGVRRARDRDLLPRGRNRGSSAAACAALPR